MRLAGAWRLLWGTRKAKATDELQVRGLVNYCSVWESGCKAHPLPSPDVAIIASALTNNANSFAPGRARALVVGPTARYCHKPPASRPIPAS